MKTSELTGAALDWAVATCEGREGEYWMNDGICGQYAPGRYWMQGGPIIEREQISPYYMPGEVGGAWRAEQLGRYMRAGPTPLIAAMRCYVASKMGDTIDVPEELTT